MNATLVDAAVTGAATTTPLRLAALLGKRPAVPLVMGILNVTPDSFSDGGQFFESDAAIAQARRMAEDGADILDIGAESTRPYGGQKPVTAEDEMERLRTVLPAVIALGRERGIPISIDTIKAKTCAWALEQGAAIANDVWGLQQDPDMARVVAEHSVPVIIMHNRDKADAGIDIVADINAFFARSLDIAAKAGIAREQIALDPGIGFGKTPEQSVETLRRYDEIDFAGLPVLVGASRKRFIASVVPSTPDKRIGGSLAAHLHAAQKGAAIIRAHDVAETVQALRIAAAIGAQSGGVGTGLPQDCAPAKNEGV
ncbi:MAG: dihydropteroate synthase [Xanthobacteraceae bacterium]|uniref:dihydropteroate synthase n=1 Tax=Pseudolabrys sp. TaxID=1960880 RepID=UPI003D0A8617